MQIRNALLLLVASLHIYFLILEMFLWKKPLGLNTFRMNLEKAEQTAVLAANQGLYNGFLAAGLIWSVIEENLQTSKHLGVFFSVCVLVAAIYGAYSVSRKILIVQGLPALFALIFCLMN